MKPETKQKMAAAKAAKRSQFAEQTIVIDDQWQIIRSDELNWELQFQGKFKGYYGSIAGALKALPVKSLGEQVNNSLADLQRTLIAICENIDKALLREKLLS